MTTSLRCLVELDRVVRARIDAPLIGARAARVDEVEHAELIAAEREPARAVALLAGFLAQLAVDAEAELAHAHHLARDADALADEEVEQLLLDARDPREPLARDRERAAQPRLERRVAHGELGDPAVVERDRGPTAPSCRTPSADRAPRTSAPELNRSPSMNSATFFSAMRASGGGLISDSASRSSFVAFSCASCAARRSRELVLVEHRGGDLAARDVDDRRGLAAARARSDRARTCRARAGGGRSRPGVIAASRSCRGCPRREAGCGSARRPSRGRVVPFRRPTGALCWMAKFDISPGNCAATMRRPGVALEANDEPDPPPTRLRH